MRTLCILILALLGTACSNSPTVVGQLYNRLDSQMSGAVLKLAEFEKPQIDAFKHLVDRFHYWHRRDQLPEYADLIENIATQLQSPDPIEQKRVTGWLQTVETFSRRFRECHPINYSNDIIRTLSKTQLDDIKANITERRANFRKRYNESTREDRIERRFNNTVKWSGWIGFKFNATQKELLRETLAQQISLRREYFKLSDAWLTDYFDILDNRHSLDLYASTEQHLDRLWHLLERAHPEQWQQNRDLWSRFVFNLGQTMTPAQRESSGSWLATMANTLRIISRRDVKLATTHYDAGCSPGKA